MSTFLHISVLHTLPIANSNRDDTGLPKVVNYGNALRGRLSSQALKRAARYLDEDRVTGFANPTGYSRTRHVAHLIAAAARAKGAEADEAKILSSIIGKGSPFGEKGKDGLISALAVVTNGEVEALADAYIAGELNLAKVKETMKFSDKKDIALWGRFFASDNSLTLDGAAQVAHAFTTHEVTVENDFFTGMDDASPVFADNAGAGHPGDQSFLAGTFLKYANVNINELVINLSANAADDVTAEDVKRATLEVIADFIERFAFAVPNGKKRATAHFTAPSYIQVSRSKSDFGNPAAHFEKPVARNRPALEDSIGRLKEANQKNDFFGRSAAQHLATSEDFESFDSMLSNIVADAEPQVDEAVAKFFQKG